MRIRTIKPEFWTNEPLSRLPYSTRLLAIALLNYADDEGYFLANPKLVAAACFPFEEDSTIIRRALDELSIAGYLRFAENEEKVLIGHIVKFSVHQRVDRANKSKLKENLNFDDNSTKPRRFLDDGTGNREQGTWKGISLRSLCEGSHNSSEEEIPPKDPLADPESIESKFEEARKAFPGRKLGFSVEFENFVKKVGGRSKAAVEVLRLLPGIEAEKVDREAKAAARAFVPEWKNFKTWINAKAWDQEFAAAGSSPAPKAASNRQAEREAKLRSGFALAAKLKESAGISAPVLPLEVEK